jgi:hypothetical protein
LTVKLTVDMSAAPEIALLAEAALRVPAQQGAAADVLEVPRQHLTLGTLARMLQMIAAAPERWWSLVRFAPDRSVKITIEDQPSYVAWLTVLPPGDAGQPCDCDVVTMIAGEAAEGAEAGPALRPGPTRVHGSGHWLRGHGTGYSVSLHARARRPQEINGRKPDVIG